MIKRIMMEKTVWISQINVGEMKRSEVGMVEKFEQMGPGLLCESSRCPEILGHRNAPRHLQQSVKEAKPSNSTSLHLPSFSQE